MSINTIKKPYSVYLTVFLFSGRKTLFFMRLAPSLAIFIIPVARTNGESHNWFTHKSGPYCSCRDIYFWPENIEVRRFKIHESCNVCVYVTVSADTTFRVETRVKVKAGDLERVRERLT